MGGCESIGQSSFRLPEVWSRVYVIERFLRYLTRPGAGPRLLKAVAGSAGLRVVGMGFGFLVGVQLARGLGPAGYGVYGIVMAAISVLMIPTELGLPQLLTREVSSALASGGEGATNAIVAWGRKIVVLSSLVIAGGALLFLATDFAPVSAEVRSALLVGLLWIPVVAIGNIYGAALRGMHNVIGGQIGELLVRPALTSLLLFLAVHFFDGQLAPTSAMAVNVFCAGVAAGLSIVLLKQRMQAAGPSRSSVPSSLSFSHALPMAMSEGMRVLGGQVGMLVLSVMASNEEAGLYRVAFGIYVVSTMPSALINVACAPTISALHTEGRDRDLARLNVWISIFLTGAAALLLLLALPFGRYAITLLFGTAYAEAIVVLLIFLAGELIASVFGHPTVVLNMMRRQKVVMWWSAIALVVNCALTVALVYYVGYAGAAFGSAAGLIVWRAGCAIFAKARMGLDTSFVTTLVPARDVRASRG